MRINVGSDDLINDKISKTLKCIKSKYYHEDYGFLGYILNVPFNFVCLLLGLLWGLWCLSWFCIMFTLSLIGCFLLGYPFVVYKCISNWGNNTRVKILLFLCIIFAPIAIVIVWVIAAVILIKENFRKHFLYPSLGGLIFPILQCDFT